MNYVNILIIGCDGEYLSVVKNSLLNHDNELGIVVADWITYKDYIEDSYFDLFIVCGQGDFKMALTEINNIKNNHLSSESPILIVVGNEVGDDDVLKSLTFGVLDFVRFPCSNIEIYTRVRTALILSSSLKKNKQQTKLINDGKERVEEVISEFVPDQIINEYIRGGLSVPQRYEEASVLFADLVDFTRKSSKLSPKILIEELSGIFSAFDNIVEKYGCMRIKTMGDGYMVVSGIPVPTKDHAVNLVEVAKEMRDYLQQRNVINAITWEVRIGINSGEVIGSTLGQFNLQFDVFGETVNAASRMEKSCEANQINVSRSTYLLVRHCYSFVERLPSDIKGLGIKRMYYLKKKIQPKETYENLSCEPMDLACIDEGVHIQLKKE